jgi:Immunity protein 26
MPFRGCATSRAAGKIMAPRRRQPAVGLRTDWPMSRLPYREGDVFAVPLRGRGFALGVVARSPKRGRILLGYFFPHLFASVPSPGELPELRPRDAIKVVRFGDLSLTNGEWPIISHLRDWDKERWPMPRFVREDPLLKRAWLITVSDDDPSIEVAREGCESGIAGYERASLLGAGVVEIQLTKLLLPGP